MDQVRSCNLDESQPTAPASRSGMANCSAPTPRRKRRKPSQPLKSAADVDVALHVGPAPCNSGPSSPPQPAPLKTDSQVEADDLQGLFKNCNVEEVADSDVNQAVCGVPNASDGEDEVCSAPGPSVAPVDDGAVAMAVADVEEEAAAVDAECDGSSSDEEAEAVNEGQIVVDDGQLAFVDFAHVQREEDIPQVRKVLVRKRDGTTLGKNVIAVLGEKRSRERDDEQDLSEEEEDEDRVGPRPPKQNASCRAAIRVCRRHTEAESEELEQLLADQCQVNEASTVAAVGVAPSAVSLEAVAGTPADEVVIKLEEEEVETGFGNGFLPEPTFAPLPAVIAGNSVEKEDDKVVVKVEEEEETGFDGTAVSDLTFAPSSDASPENTVEEEEEKLVFVKLEEEEVETGFGTAAVSELTFAPQPLLETIADDASTEEAKVEEKVVLKEEQGVEADDNALNSCYWDARDNDLDMKYDYTHSYCTPAAGFVTVITIDADFGDVEMDVSIAMEVEMLLPTHTITDVSSSDSGTEWFGQEASAMDVDFSAEERAFAVTFFAEEEDLMEFEDTPTKESFQQPSACCYPFPSPFASLAGAPQMPAFLAAYMQQKEDSVAPLATEASLQPSPVTALFQEESSSSLEEGEIVQEEEELEEGEIFQEGDLLEEGEIRITVSIGAAVADVPGGIGYLISHSTEEISDCVEEADSGCIQAAEKQVFCGSPALNFPPLPDDESVYEDSLASDDEEEADNNASSPPASNEDSKNNSIGPESEALELRVSSPTKLAIKINSQAVADEENDIADSIPAVVPAPAAPVTSSFALIGTLDTTLYADTREDSVNESSGSVCSNNESCVVLSSSGVEAEEEEERKGEDNEDNEDAYPLESGEIPPSEYNLSDVLRNVARKQQEEEDEASSIEQQPAAAVTAAAEDEDEEEKEEQQEQESTSSYSLVLETITSSSVDVDTSCSESGAESSASARGIGIEDTSSAADATEAPSAEVVVIVKADSIVSSSIEESSSAIHQHQTVEEDEGIESAAEEIVAEESCIEEEPTADDKEEEEEEDEPTVSLEHVSSELCSSDHHAESASTIDESLEPTTSTSTSSPTSTSTSSTAHRIIVRNDATSLQKPSSSIGFAPVWRSNYDEAQKGLKLALQAAQNEIHSTQRLLQELVAECAEVAASLKEWRRKQEEEEKKEQVGLISEVKKTVKRVAPFKICVWDDTNGVTEWV